jgi:hypothetical protein
VKNDHLDDWPRHPKEPACGIAERIRCQLTAQDKALTGHGLVLVPEARSHSTIAGGSVKAVRRLGPAPLGPVAACRATWLTLIPEGRPICEQPCPGGYYGDLTLDCTCSMRVTGRCQEAGPSMCASRAASRGSGLALRQAHLTCPDEPVRAGSGPLLEREDELASA